MTYRYKTTTQFRSWNVSALGLKTEPEEPNSRDRQKPRRESWSQPPQRGKSTRGRGVWVIDNRPSIPHRRHTMPNSRDDFQDHNYDYRSNDESINHWEEDNPIAEEPQNLSTSPENDFDYIKENDRDELENRNHQDETSSWNRKHSVDNIYRPPKSRSRSYTKESLKSNSSSDDGYQSRGYLTNGSDKYEQEHHKVQRSNSWEREHIGNEPNQAWTHDKYESLESDFDQEDKKDASTPVSPLNINDELPKKDNIKESTCEFPKKINNPDDQSKQVIFNPKFPNQITINISELTKESSSNDESVISQTPIQEDLKNEVADHEVVSKVTTPEVTFEINPETNPKTNLEVTSNVVTSLEEELPLINLDEDNSTGTQPVQPRISEDILSLDWNSYQKNLMEQELLNPDRQPIQTNNSHKLDTSLKDFDALLL